MTQELETRAYVVRNKVTGTLYLATVRKNKESCSNMKHMLARHNSKYHLAFSRDPQDQALYKSAYDEKMNNLEVIPIIITY